eukprot:6201438-Pleurochrysis_carterae.AAC.3
MRAIDSYACSIASAAAKRPTRICLPLSEKAQMLPCAHRQKATGRGARARIHPRRCARAT